MNWSGLSDSVAMTGTPAQCPRCRTTARLSRGLCLGCLLGSALDEGDQLPQEDFAALLEAVPASDTFRRLGNYEVLEEIGRGGMGVIYRARQRHSRRIVAVKRMASYHADSRETLARFRREAEAAASLDHPNILPIYEVGETDEGIPYFSMKYAPGGTLQEIGPALRNKPREIVRLLAKVSRAVEYAHRQGILHRDLKPGNILLDAHVEPLVSDFGLAKWLDTSTDLTRTLTIFGTPGYIAPEQARGARAQLTPAADVYSLGAILFDLFTGRPPFLGEHALAVIQQASEKEAPKLRSLVPALDRDLETICAKCLERELKARYQSADALADDLERWLERRPITARPVLPPTRAWRWAKRNPTLATATIAALVFATAATFLFFSHNSALPPAPSDKSVAVLPFENLSDKENVYFTQGIQDEILTKLANIAELRVPGRASVMEYQAPMMRDTRSIGRELGVGHLLTGSMQRTGDQLRVSVRLIDTRDDTQVWTKTYHRPLADVFSIESDITKTTAARLHATVLPNEEIAIERTPTRDLTAFALYAQAKELVLKLGLTGNLRPTLEQAADLLNRAVSHDRTFLLAYCQLAFVHDLLYFFGHDHTPARLALAETALQSALRINPNAGETHLAQARHLYYGYLQYDQARAEIALAERSLPNDPLIFQLRAFIDRRQNRWKEAEQDLKRALERDPRNFFILQQLSLLYEKDRRYPEIAAILDRALAITPGDIDTRVDRGVVDLNWRADTQPLYATIQSVLAEKPDAAKQIADSWLLLALCERDAAAAEQALTALGQDSFAPDAILLNHTFGEGLVARMTKDETKARAAFTRARAEQEKIVQEQPDYGPSVCVLGLIDAALGRKEDALREGQRALELLPPAKDAINGSHIQVFFAITCAWAGEKDLAIEQLATLAQTAGYVSYGTLKLHPFWDPLRGDPRFEEIVASLAPQTTVTGESTVLPNKSIAVLPFENLSQEKTNTYIAEGIQGEILTKLAAMRELKVTSRGSSAKYQSRPDNVKAVARELGVATILEGAVQRMGDKVRASVQLIDARTDTQLWANSYERELKDLFTVESEIAEEIAQALKANLSPRELHVLATAPTQNTEAYDLFLRAQYEFHQAERSLVSADFDRAEAFYRQALAQDPNFVEAAAGFAYSQLSRHWFVSRLTPRKLEEVKSFSDHALALAPDSPEAHFALGIFFYCGQRRYSEALAEFSKTLQLQPNNALARQYCAWVYRRRGEWERSIADAQKAEELDPRDDAIPTNLGITYALLRQWKDAKQSQSRALAMDPHNVIAALILAMTHLNSTGDIHSARRAFDSIPPGLRTSSPSVHGDVADIIGVRVYLDVIERHFSDAFQTLENEAPNGERGQLLAARVALGVLAGENEAAKSAAEQVLPLLEARLKEIPDDTFPMTELAWVYLALGRNDDALRVARQAAELISVQRDTVSGPLFQTGLAQIQARAGAPDEAVNSLRQLMSIPAGQWISLVRLKFDPVWDPLRNRPDFQQLLSGKELIWPNK